MACTRSLVVVAVVLASLARPEAQDKGAWFGTPVPPPLSDPRKPVMKYDDVFAPVPVQFAHRPGRFDELLDGAALKKDQQASRRLLAREPRTPATRCGAAAPRRRPSCSTIEWTVNEFKAAGLKDAAGRNIRRHRRRCGCRSRGSSRWSAIRRSAPARTTVTLQSAFPQPGGATIPGGSAHRAGRSSSAARTEADLAGRDVKGKIAVVRVRPEPSLFGSAEQGAAARARRARRRRRHQRRSRGPATRSTSTRASPAARRRASWSAARTAGSSSR